MSTEGSNRLVGVDEEEETVYEIVVYPELAHLEIVVYPELAHLVRVEEREDVVTVWVKVRYRTREEALRELLRVLKEKEDALSRRLSEVRRELGYESL